MKRPPENFVLVILVLFFATGSSWLLMRTDTCVTEASLTNATHQLTLDSLGTVVDSLEARVSILTGNCRVMGEYEWTGSDSVTVIMRCEEEK